MNEIIIKRSASNISAFFALGVVIGVIAVLMITNGNAGGWCLVLLVFGMMLAAILGLLDRSPRVIITENGITIRELGNQEIPWNQIKSIHGEVLPYAGNTAVLELLDGTKRRFGTNWLDVPPSKFLAMVKGHIRTSVNE